MIVDAHGQPFQEPDERADTKAESLMPSMRAELTELVRKAVAQEVGATPEWYRGAPPLEQIPAKSELPDGVSLAFDAGLGVWVLRDEYLEQPALGSTPSKELALDALQNYLSYIQKRQHRKK